MDTYRPIADPPRGDVCELYRVPVRDGALVCHETPAGVWVCCAKDGAPHCAHGLTLQGAVANWERAQAFLE